jgi:transposase
LARRHLHDGTLVLYEVSSSYVDGRCCPLPRFGHSRDHRADKMQIVYGLVCAPDGCPVAIKVVAGNTGDRPSGIRYEAQGALRSHAGCDGRRFRDDHSGPH